jgi:hypothetical protein
MMATYSPLSISMLNPAERVDFLTDHHVGLQEGRRAFDDPMGARGLRSRDLGI